MHRIVHSGSSVLGDIVAQDAGAPPQRQQRGPRTTPVDIAVEHNIDTISRLSTLQQTLYGIQLATHNAMKELQAIMGDTKIVNSRIDFVGPRDRRKSA